MEWLEAATAFTVVMMVFSTLVTVVLETIHRVFRMREKGLLDLIDLTYSQVIIPQLKRRISDIRVTAFQEDSTKLHGGNDSWCSYFFGAKLTELSTAGFVERLAQTEEGQALYLEARRRGQAYLDRVIMELTSKYEAYGDSASQVFQRRSRLISCIIGLLFAFSLNLDVLHLFTTLLTDQKVRVELILQGDKAAEQAHKALAALEVSKTNSKDIENLTALRANLNKIVGANSTITSYSIPIGWETAPWRQGSSDGGHLWGSVRWFFSVFFGGLLVGLGSPFWFDMFSRLARLVRQVRNPLTPVQQAKEAITSKKTIVVTPLALPRVFEEAAKAALIVRSKGRPILDSGGTILRKHNYDT